MAYRELVIKIDEELCRDIFSDTRIMKYAGRNNEKMLMATLLRAIRNGVMLPKGHGRLKDIDWIDDNCENHHSDTDGSWCYAWGDIDNAPTIIVADKESEE